jgi:hypothetical protein
MKIVNYKELCKAKPGTLFATLNKMNEFSELFRISVEPDGRKLIDAPLTDKQIDFDENTFNRTSGTFMILNDADLTAYLDRLNALKGSSGPILADLPKLDLRRIVPVVRPETEAYFVDPQLVKPYLVEMSSKVQVLTAPFAIGVEFSLLGVSETATLLEHGLVNVTDNIDTAMRLSRVFLHVEALGGQAEVIPVTIMNLPTAQAHAAPQARGNYREMALNFSSHVDLPVGIYTAEGQMSAIISHGARVKLGVSGSVNLQLGNTRCVAQRVESFRQGEVLVRTRVLGYELEAYRTNLNGVRQAA